MSEVDKTKDTSEFLDELEKIVVSGLIPTVKLIKLKMPNIKGNDETIARNIIAKIGTRIMFGESGKEVIDKLILPDK